MASLIAEDRFVGYLDVLGWGSRVVADLASTLELYDSLLTHLKWVSESQERTLSVRVFSDSILLVSESLGPVLQASNAFQFLALANDCLLRGGIAFGKHAERSDSGQLHVVSAPLVLAAQMEKTIRVPAVGIHASAMPTLDYEQLLALDVFQRPLLFFRGQWIANPFNPWWGTSAATRVLQMREKYPEHAEKYDWFLSLYEDVRTRARLVP